MGHNPSNASIQRQRISTDPHREYRRPDILLQQRDVVLGRRALGKIPPLDIADDPDDLPHGLLVFPSQEQRADLLAQDFLAREELASERLVDGDGLWSVRQLLGLREETTFEDRNTHDVEEVRADDAEPRDRRLPRWKRSSTRCTHRANRLISFDQYSKSGKLKLRSRRTCGLGDDAKQRFPWILVNRTA